MKHSQVRSIKTRSPVRGPTVRDRDETNAPCDELLEVLLSDVARLHQALLSKALVPLGLTVLQLRFLEEDCGLAPKGIEQCKHPVNVDMSLATVRSVMDALVDGGILQRCSNSPESRPSSVQLTAAGCRKLLTARKILDDVSSAACAGLGEDEIQHMQVVLQQLTGRLYGLITGRSRTRQRGSMAAALRSKGLEPLGLR